MGIINYNTSVYNVILVGSYIIETMCLYFILNEIWDCSKIKDNIIIWFIIWDIGIIYLLKKI